MGFILKDWYGKEQVFNQDKIFVKDENGELVQFTQGTGGSASPDVRYVTFMSYDGSVEYGKKAVAVGDDCADPIARGVFAKPKRKSDSTNAYFFYDWATTPNGPADADWNKAITEDKTVYANFAAVRITASGECGENCTWEFLENGVLSILGVGAMTDYETYNASPWYEQHRKSITSLIVEDGITHIGSYAFYGCSTLTGVTIPDTVTSIGSFAFQVCSSLTNFTFPAGVTVISDNVLRQCFALTNISIPNGVTSIGSSAFSACNALTSVTIPDTVTSIDKGAFQSCKSLTSITIPEGVASIADNLLYGCTALTSVSIPEGVTSIGSSAFYGCTSLTSIIIPASVASIGLQAFNTSNNLASAVFMDTSGWYVTTTKDAPNGTNVDLTDASNAAKYLRTTYISHYWYNPK